MRYALSAIHGYCFGYCVYARGHGGGAEAPWRVESDGEVVMVRWRSGSRDKFTNNWEYKLVDDGGTRGN